MSLAFYTGFMGSNSNWARVITDVPSQEYDCQYFTNNPSVQSALEKTQWKRVWLDNPIHNDNIKDTMETKELRCCPERFSELQKYDQLCWIDSKKYICKWDQFLEMQNTLQNSPEIAIISTAHIMKYRDVWGEQELAIQQEKQAREKESMKAQIQDQLEKGMDPYKPQRIDCGIRLMRMNAVRKELGETWLDHIRRCGIEDQISWQFIHQMQEPFIRVFPHQQCWVPV